ncbi:MAG: hypothetical protein LBT04_04765 [Prevotellaceae bacterium]|jgi:hypothetical protein|nr:hypothetical protein [Prevotellaceae bacterium]
MPDNTLIQVKRSDNIGRNVIDNFFAAVQRNDQKLFDKNIAENKPVGYIIAFSFGRGAVEEVARLHNKENIIIELVRVDKIVPIAKKPTISVEISDLSTVETLHATSLQPPVNAESPENTEGLRVKPAMTAQSKGSSKEHSKGIILHLVINLVSISTYLSYNQ